MEISFIYICQSRSSQLEWSHINKYLFVNSAVCLHKGHHYSWWRYTSFTTCSTISKAWAEGAGLNTYKGHMASKYLPIMPGAFSCVRAVDREQTVAFISPARHYHVVVLKSLYRKKSICITGQHCANRLYFYSTVCYFLQNQIICWPSADDGWLGKLQGEELFLEEITHCTTKIKREWRNAALWCKYFFFGTDSIVYIYMRAGFLKAIGWELLSLFKIR